MLRINLLPAYIAERRRVTTAIVLSSLLFLIVTGVMLGYDLGSLKGQVAKSQSDDRDMQAKAQTEQAYEAETASKLTTIVPIYEKVSFVEQVRFHNILPGRIYRNAARYTYRKVEYNAMAVTGNNLALNGTVSSLDDIGRFYLTMFANPDVTAVSFTGVPDWKTVQAQKPIVIPGGPPPAPPRYNIAMNATLVSAVVTPTLPASLAGTVGGTTGTSGGGMMGGGGMPMSMPMPGGSGAPGAMPSGMPMAGPSGGPMPGASGMPGPSGSGRP